MLRALRFNSRLGTRTARRLKSTGPTSAFGFGNRSNKVIEEYASAATKSALPVGVSGAAALGFSLQDWVFIVTIVYTVLQIALLIYKFLKKKNDD